MQFNLLAAALALLSVTASVTERLPFLHADLESALEQLAPDDVWRMVARIMFDERVVSLAPQDSKSFLKEVYRLPIVLAYLTRYAPFINMTLDTELFSLVWLAKALRSELYLAYEARVMCAQSPRCAVLPRSELTVNYLNDRFFRNHRIDIARRRQCFSNVANGLFSEKEVEMLGMLISVVSDDIFGGWSMTVENIPLILQMVNHGAASRLCRLSQDKQRARLIVSICLVGGGFSTVEHLLKSDPAFISRLNEAMISIASEHECTDYFSRDRGLKCSKPLLDWLSERNHDKARYVRLLFLIRGSSGSDVNAEFDGMIQEVSRDGNEVYSLVSTVLCARNQELLTRLLPLVLYYCKTHRWQSIITHQNIGAMISYEDYRRLMDRMETYVNDFDRCYHQKMVQICKRMPEAHFSDEWVNTLPDWYRLAVLAMIGAEGRFEAAIGGGINGANALLRAMQMIVDCVDDSVPFIEIALRMGFTGLDGEFLGQKRFLRALLLSKGRDSVFERLKQWEITPRRDFFEALLDEHDLRDAFLEKGKRLNISVRISIFNRRILRSIVELLNILRVRVDTDAFSLLDVNGTALDADAIAERVKELKAVGTLDALTACARKPGFLACLALLHVKTDIDRLGGWSYEYFKQLNPLRFSAYELLRQWDIRDRMGFIKSCNCCVVLLFFAVELDEATWEVTCMQGYSATLENVAKRMRMSLVFSSEREMDRFKREVLPVIDEAARAQCRVKSSDWGCIIL